MWWLRATSFRIFFMAHCYSPSCLRGCAHIWFLLCSRSSANVVPMCCGFPTCVLCASPACSSEFDKMVCNLGATGVEKHTWANKIQQVVLAPVHSEEPAAHEKAHEIQWNLISRLSFPSQHSMAAFLAISHSRLLPSRHHHQRKLCSGSHEPFFDSRADLGLNILSGAAHRKTDRIHASSHDRERCALESKQQ